jgi:hypothetical protein
MVVTQSLQIIADLVVSSKTAVESLVAGEDIQNANVFPKALHELCGRVDAFHASLQTVPARNPKFNSGSDVSSRFHI